MPMPGPMRREFGTCVRGWVVTGFPLTQMPLAISWATRWSWRRTSSVSSVRGGTRPLALTRRPSPSCYAYRGSTLRGPLRGGGCGSCTPAWLLWLRCGWCCYSAISCLATIILTSLCLSASWWTTPTRYPLDPEKSNRALGFPALITGLCQFYRVPVTPSKVIRPPITRQAQGDTQQAADAPPP